jgi:hypothetical protein
MQKDAKILLGTTGVGVDANGTWIDVSEMEFPIRILIIGAGAGDAITINLTSKFPLPANAVHDIPLQAAITADGFFDVTAPVTGIKARKPAATQTTTVYALLRAKRS